MGALCLSSKGRHIGAGIDMSGCIYFGRVSVRLTVRLVIIMITIASINKICASPLIHGTFSRGRKEVCQHYLEIKWLLRKTDIGLVEQRQRWTSIWRWRQ